MTNLYFIQLIGILLTVAGMVALTAASGIVGRPLSRDERLQMGKERSNVYRLPLKLEMIVSAVVFLAGIGILTWSKFNFCAFLGYWLSDIPIVIKLFLSC